MLGHLGILARVVMFATLPVIGGCTLLTDFDKDISDAGPDAAVGLCGAFEENDVATDAKLIDPDTPITAAICTRGDGLADRDFFRFQVGAGQGVRLTLALTNEQPNLDIALRDVRGEVIVTEGGAEPGDDVIEVPAAELDTPNIHRVEVLAAADGDENDYTLTLELIDPMTP